MNVSRHIAAILVAILPFIAEGQRLLRSHLLQPAESDTVCALVIRDVDAFSRAQVHTFRLTNATRLAPGDYHVAYFIDTAFVHADFMHVSHDPSVMDQFLVVGKVRVADVRFGAAVKEGNVTAIDLDQFTP